jgi:hypothetical protein
MKRYAQKRKHNQPPRLKVATPEIKEKGGRIYGRSYRDFVPEKPKEL